MITPEMLREWGSPWSLEQLVPLYAGRQSLTIHEILAADIHVGDAVWFVGEWLEHVGVPVWSIVDAAVREWAPAALDAKGFHDGAKALRDLPEIVDEKSARAAQMAADRIESTCRPRRAAGNALAATYHAARSASYVALTDGTSVEGWHVAVAREAVAAGADPGAILTTLLELADRSIQ